MIGCSINLEGVELPVKKIWLTLTFILVYIVVVTLLFRIPFLDRLYHVFLIKDMFNGVTSEMSFLILLLFPIIWWLSCMDFW